jgi:hypothetical protein
VKISDTAMMNASIIHGTGSEKRGAILSYRRGF